MVTAREQLAALLRPARRAQGARSKGGKRADLGDRFFRSRWEANYARYLDFLVKHGRVTSWEYEAHEFWFEGVKRGTRSYKPDFRVVLPGGRHEWHEVKGWMDATSKTQLKRMARYFPEEKVVVIDAAWFRAIRRQGVPALIPHWESGE